MELSLLDKVVEIAREAGSIALNFQKNGFESYRKKENELVTEADLTVNTYLKESLLNLLPEAGWLSEESVDDKSRLSKKFVWIVDPIDGTVQFAKGTDQWVISIALVENNKPIMGVIYNPRKDQMFFTERCIGAFLNDYRIENNIENKQSNGKKQIILTTKSKSNFFKIFQYGFNRKFHIEQIGSLAYILALTSLGYAGSCISFKSVNEWDIAAGVLMLKESGCSFKFLDNENSDFIFNKENVYRKRGFVGANKEIFSVLKKKLN